MQTSHGRIFEHACNQKKFYSTKVCLLANHILLSQVKSLYSHEIRDLRPAGYYDT